MLFLEDSEIIREIGVLRENKIFIGHSMLWLKSEFVSLVSLYSGSLLSVGTSMCGASGKHLAHFL